MSNYYIPVKKDDYHKKAQMVRTYKKMLEKEEVKTDYFDKIVSSENINPEEIQKKPEVFIIIIYTVKTRDSSKRKIMTNLN